jgi:two-component system chemotaxis response regulator CheB
MDNLRVDFCVPIAQMGRLLAALVSKPRRTARPVPANVRTEAEIAERVLSDVDQVEGLGRQVPYNCPNCGGVLWEMGASRIKRYRCHTGHSFTAATLLASQSEKIEEMLWVSLRMFEERKNLLKSMGKTAHRRLKGSARQSLGETQGYIDRLRGMLLTPESQTDDDTFARVKGLMAEPSRAQSTR